MDDSTQLNLKSKDIMAEAGSVSDIVSRSFHRSKVDYVRLKQMLNSTLLSVKRRIKNVIKSLKNGAIFPQCK